MAEEGNQEVDGETMIVIKDADMTGYAIDLTGGANGGGGQTINDELAGFSFCFWHMIDIVWIVLFPLFYLLQ